MMAMTRRPTPPPSEAFIGNTRWWVLLTIGVGTFMSALDGSIVNTLLPILSRELGTTIAGIEWITTIYLLVISALLLSIGRAGDLFGHKRLYVAGFILFITGSALCGFATSARALTALRVLQALGAAMLMATAPAILTRSFPPSQRGRALGALGTFTYLGLTAGPSLGGWLATSFGWRWVFFINVPIGILAVILAVTSILDDHAHYRDERFDFIGASIFTVGLTALMIALNQGHAWGWGSALTTGLLAGGVVLLFIFVRVEANRFSPMLDLTLFRSRVFSASTLSALLNYACVYSILFVMPFLLIQSRGLSAQQAGIVLTAQPIIMAIVAPISGAFSDLMGSRLLATVGMLVLTAGLTGLAILARTGSLEQIAICLAVVGLGVGTFVSPNNSALMGAAPSNRQGIASGVLATARNVGMAFGVGIAGAVFTTVMSRSGMDGPSIAFGVQASLFTAAALGLV